MSKLMPLLVRAFLPLATRHALIDGHGTQCVRSSSPVPAAPSGVRIVAFAAPSPHRNAREHIPSVAA